MFLAQLAIVTEAAFSVQTFSGKSRGWAEERGQGFGTKDQDGKSIQPLAV